MSQLVALDLNLHHKQGIAFQTEATEVLYGGAAGGGKSHLMRVAAIVWCSAIAGLQVYLFRRIRDDLIKNHIEGPKGLRSLLGPWVLAGLVNIVEDEIRFWNGSKIYLCHCKDEKDRYKYLGAEIHVLLIDELTTFTETIYRFLRGRVRAVGLPPLADGYKGRFPRILCSSNPGGVGHHFVKMAFVDAAPELEVWQTPDGEGGMLRQYIPARLDDNPSMGSDDPNYRQRLRGLGNDALVKAMEDGDWNVVAGAYFPEWRTEKHVVSPFTIPDEWLRFRSCDWGSAKPFSVGWWAVVGDYPEGWEGQFLPKGAIVRYREWYGASAPNVGLKLTAKEVALGVKVRDMGEEIAYGVMDPGAFQVDGGPSHAEIMAKEGVFFRRADNKRIPERGAMGGWDQVRARLKGDEDSDFKPLLYVFSTCRDLIRTLPALQHNENKPEDADSTGEDHAPDECRYACMSRPYQPTKREVKKDTKLEYKAQPDGRIIANKSVFEIIMDKQKRKERGE